MWCEARMAGYGPWVMLCIFMAGALGGCTELKPLKPMNAPTQATPEQAAERDRESPTPRSCRHVRRGRISNSVWSISMMKAR